MSISSKLEKLETDITSAYNAIDNKGGTIPQNKNTENLANAISSISDIPEGIFIQEGQPTKTTTEALWLKEEDTSVDIPLLDRIPGDTVLYLRNGTSTTTYQAVLNSLTQEQKDKFNSKKYLLLTYNAINDGPRGYDLVGFSSYNWANVHGTLRLYTGAPVIEKSDFGIDETNSSGYASNELEYILENGYWSSADLIRDGSVIIHQTGTEQETGVYVTIDGIRYIVYKSPTNGQWTKILDTSNADAVAGNILSGKTAFVDNTKLTGSMTNNGALSYTPTTSSQSIPAGYTSGGTISAVTSAIDSNISAGNIKSGTTILGVTGNVVELNGETKTVTPTTSQQTITPTSPKNAMTQVTVNAVTSSIDNNIIAENIKKDVSILRSNWNI